MRTSENKYRPEIVEYAKELYLTVDNEGKRVYSYSSIVDAIRQKLDTKVSRATIGKWVKKYKWDKLLQKVIVASACDKDKRETKETITRVVESLPVDEYLVEKLAKVKRWVVVNHIEMAKKLYEEVQKRDAKDKAFVRLCEVTDRVGKSIYEMLADVDKEDGEKEGHPIIIINEISSASNSE